MINIYLGLFVMVTAINCFTFTYRYNGINRTFMEMPISLIEMSIPLYSEDDDFIMRFNREELISNLTYYFDNTITKYTNNYHLDYYFTYTDNEEMCLDDNCTAIEITLNADVFLLAQYNKTMRYEIRSNIDGN